MLPAEQEQALREKQEFKDFASEWPIMVVVASGTFMVGSPEGERHRGGDEGRTMK